MLFAGMGQPVHLGDDDDDGGFSGRSKDSNEQMMTLMDFLNEGSKSPTQVNIHLAVMDNNYS